MNNLYNNPECRELVEQLKDELQRTRVALGETDARNPKIQAIIDLYWRH